MKYSYPKLNVNIPSKEEIKEKAPGKATKALIEKLEKEGISCWADRHEAQQPQCTFGLRGECCRLCLMGPCRITEKTPRGICGLDVNGIAMGHLLRMLAAGCAAHGQHTFDVLMTLKKTGNGETGFTIAGEERVFELAELFGIETSGRELSSIAGDVTDVLIDDLTRWDEVPIRTMMAIAPKERIETWKDLDILPRSSFFEVFESLHRTTLGANSDWRNLAKQDLRTSLAYCWASIFGSNLATEILFGVPKVKTGTVSYSILKEGYVNILVHGHTPPMVEAVAAAVRDQRLVEYALDKGAKGIVLGGMCCSGLELLARHGVPSVTNILGQELAMMPSTYPIYLRGRWKMREG
jgi:carbon-monoxide dehydrogenase catalytic subunit